MDLKAMVGTAEVLLKVLQKCEAAGEINNAERIVISQWLTDLKLAVSNQQLAEDKVEEPITESQPAVEPVIEQQEPEQLAEPEPISETEIEIVAEQVSETIKVQEQTEPAPEQPQTIEEPVPEQIEVKVEELEIIERPKLNRNAVKSLYEDDTEAENLPEPEDFIVEKEITLSPEDERILINLEVPRDVNTAAKAGTPLTQLIGINDKFIITRDLFGGDTFAFNRTLATLDNFDDLNDALIYLQKTYDWDTNSDGAQLLIEKLVTKLG